MSYDDRGPWDFEPTIDELIEEFITHFSGGDCDHYCGYCFEAWELRYRGIEDVTLEDVFLMRQAEEHEREDA